MQCIMYFIVIFVFDNSLHWNSICVQISVGRAVSGATVVSTVTTLTLYSNHRLRGNNYLTSL